MIVPPLTVVLDFLHMTVLMKYPVSVPYLIASVGFALFAMFLHTHLILKHCKGPRLINTVQVPMLEYTYEKRIIMKKKS